MKSKQIPILIYHESGMKRINGGGLNQSYVKYCIKQAEKYNDEVVFLGHPSMKNFANKFVDVTSFSLPRYDEFQKVFVNMSDYKESWTKSCFKAYYAYEKYMIDNDIEECIILDSDVLLYHTFTTEDEYSKYDAALLVNPDQNMHDLPFENELSWVAAGIVGYFKRDALIRFNDFCIDMFKNHKDILDEKWKMHQKYHISGGVCDMSLMYLWYISEDESNNIYNLSNSDAPLYFDDDAHELNGFMPGKYGLKKIFYKNHNPYIVTDDGIEKETKMLHFVGTYKAYMYDYYHFEKLGIKSLLRYAYLEKIFPILLKARIFLKK